MISNLATEYCSNDAAFTLTATPTGGTFDGPGVTGTTFGPKPSRDRDQLALPTDYTDAASGCTYQATATTTIFPETPAPQILCGTTTTNSVEFTWNNVGAAQYEITVTSTSNGTNTTVVTGTSYTETGLATNESVTASVIALGTAPCGNSAATSVTCTAENCPTITPTIINVAAQYCSDEATFTLQATPTGGTWSGTSGVSGEQFNPATAALGIVTITYDYTDAATGLFLFNDYYY